MHLVYRRMFERRKQSYQFDLIIKDFSHEVFI